MSNTLTIERDATTDGAIALGESTHPVIVPGATQQTVKTPGTRLLDLLAGWGRYVDRDEVGDEETAPLIDAGLSSDELAGMYQQAGAEVYDLEGDAEAEAVRRWVLEKILPALLA